MVEAFNILSASRPVTMNGPGPIPLSEVYAYCQMFGIDDPDERHDLVMLLQAADAGWLEQVRKDVK